MTSEQFQRAAVADGMRRPTPITSGWEHRLLCSQNGNAKPILANAITALTHAPEWSSVLAWDEFATRPCTQERTPWHKAAGEEWTDQDDRKTADWLQHHGVLVGVDVAGQAVQTVAMDNPVHPVREWLESLEWGDCERLDSWLSLYFGAEPTDYSAAAGSRWLLSAVARIMKPRLQGGSCSCVRGWAGHRKKHGTTGDVRAVVHGPLTRPREQGFIRSDHGYLVCRGCRMAHVRQSGDDSGQGVPQFSC